MTEPAVDYDPELIKKLEERVLAIPKLIADLRTAYPEIKPMPYWFQLARDAADQLEKLYNWRQLHGGDVMSLDGEVERFRADSMEQFKEIEQLEMELDRLEELSEDKEKYILQLEHRLEAICDIATDAVPYAAKKWPKINST